MRELDIILHPDPRLKKACAPVEEVTPALRELADAMLRAMYAAPGIGLAAPQVGVLKRLLVMDCAGREDGDGEEEAPRPMVLVNPEIAWASEETSMRNEGCLSIPDHFADVERPAEVEVAWTDLDGAARRERFGGIQAACVQHEIDHLNGKLIIDYLNPVRRSIVTRKMMKLKKERARARA